MTRVWPGWENYDDDAGRLCVWRIGLVIEEGGGVTTPWSWASREPFLSAHHDDDVLLLFPNGCSWTFMPATWWMRRVDGMVPWLTSTRLPEPLSPEARALVQAARGAK